MVSLNKDIQNFIKQRAKSGHLASAYNSSLLAYNGAPIEFTTSSLKPSSLYCTIDPFVPEYPPKLDTNTFQSRINLYLPTNQQVNLKHTALYQAKNQLKFGSWLGIKYHTNKTNYKIYTEVPNTKAAIACIFPQQEFNFEQLEKIGLRLLMKGITTQSNDKEYYFQWHSGEISFDDIKKVAAFFNCQHLYGQLKNILENALALNDSNDFPVTTYGFSIVYGEDNALSVFSLFTMAPTFFDDNALVSPKIEQLMTNLNIVMPLFSSLKEIQPHIQHNVVGFSIAQNGMTGINCTFSPQNIAFNTLSMKPFKTDTCMTSFRDNIELLQPQQLGSGAFISHVRTPDGQCYVDGNAFITAQVLRNLTDNKATRPIIDKALDFLLDCMIKPGHFSYWPVNKHPTWMGDNTIAADIDDTAIITEVLYRYKRITLKTMRETLVAMSAYKVKAVNTSENSWAECSTYFTWMNDTNNLSQLDCCVNTNALILLYLANKQETPTYYYIVKMLNNALSWSDGDYNKIKLLTPYYTHPNEWLETLKYGRSLGMTVLTPFIKQLSAWALLPDCKSAPMYCRHDGKFLWTSNYLHKLRTQYLPHKRE
ncbi:hypothetical protein AADZ91_02890 [Colwelliaceae bacterium 6441]